MLIKYSALSLSSTFLSMHHVVVLSVIISLIVSLGFILSAQTMHESLLINVLRWGMWLFDTTPMGRILNRFSKDVDTVDNVLPQVLRAWCMTFFSVNFYPAPFVLSSSFFSSFYFILFWFQFHKHECDAIQWNSITFYNIHFLSSFLCQLDLLLITMKISM